MTRTHEEQDRLGMLAYKWGLSVGGVILAILLIVLAFHPWAR